MKLATIAVSIAMAGIFSLFISGIGDARQIFGLEFVPTDYKPFNVCDFGDCGGVPGLSGSGEFENDQNFENEAKADQELKIEQHVKCEHVRNCNPEINVDKSLTTQDEREYKTEQEYEGTGGENYEDSLEIVIDFDGDADDYGKGKISVNDVSKKFDVEEELDEHGNPLRINYYFVGYAPEESEVCVKNLDNDEKNCEEVYEGDHEVRLKFPE